MEIETARAKLYKSIDDYGLNHINTIELSMELDKLIEKDLNKRDRYVIENIRYRLEIEELQEIINKKANKISILEYRIESQGL